MGYTHYWTQKRDFTSSEWKRVTADVRAILDEASKHQVRIGNGFGEPGSEPEFTRDKIWFNGINEDGCETFEIIRKRRPLEPWQRGHSNKGWGFCKTRRGPYDVAVTAVLIYLHSEYGYDVSSDGEPSDWTGGLALAKEALPGHRQILKIPIRERQLA